MTTNNLSTTEALEPQDMTDDELKAAIEFHEKAASKFRNEAAKIWRLRVRMDGGIAIDKQMLAEMRERRAARSRTSSVSATVDESGWLLEKMHNGNVHYIAADYVLQWTDDPNKALRLARRGDAEALCTIVEDCEKIAEHGWPTASTVAPQEQNDLVDEVQHRMDQVVEAAVEWHQAGREGSEWFEPTEKLGAAIDSLLELRGSPRIATAECFCGTELEAGLCPNGHDPVQGSPRLTDLQAAYNQGIEDAKYAIRATGSEGWEGSQFKPYFINQIARTCSPYRYTGGTPPFTADSSPAKAAAEEIASLSYARHRDEKIVQFTAIIDRYFAIPNAQLSIPAEKETDKEE